MNKQRIDAIELRSLLWSSIGIAYMGIGIPFSNAFGMIYAQNLTDGVVSFSLDGINDAFYLPVYAYQRIDIEWNKDTENSLDSPVGMRLYVRLVDPLNPPTTGSVNITGSK